VEGLATMAIAWLVFHENVDRRLLLGAFAILAGAVLLSWEGQGVAFNPGAMLVVGACVAWGIDNNLTRKISATDPTIIAMAKGLVAGSVNVVLALLTGAALPSPAIIAAAGLVGLLGVVSALSCSFLLCGTLAPREPARTIRSPLSSGRFSQSPCSATS
jgi:drug/metabolite transporter (DMT)-like permease